MLFGKEELKISTTQRTTPRTTEMSLKKRREEQYLKAQQKLLQLQRYQCLFFLLKPTTPNQIHVSISREQATRIKAQQSQSKLMQMVLAKQKELEEKRRKKEQELKRKEEEEERRRQEIEESKRLVDFAKNDRGNSMSKYQTQFSNTNFDPHSETKERGAEEREKGADQRRQHAKEKERAFEEEKLRLQLEGKRRKRQKEKEAALLKKQALEEKKRLLLEEMERRKAAEEAEKARKEEAAYKEKLDRWRIKYQKLSLPTGQKFIDKSTETKILDSKKKETKETKQSDDDMATAAGTNWPEKVAENELENRIGSSLNRLAAKVKEKKKIGNPFTQEVCESLRVPCR